MSHSQMLRLQEPIGSPGIRLIFENFEEKFLVVKLTALDVWLISDWISQCFESVTSFLWKAFFVLILLSVFLCTAVTLFLFLANARKT